MDDISFRELRQVAQDLRDGRVAYDNLYPTIQQLGQAGYFEARPDIENFLVSADAELRHVALNVLAVHWKLEDYWSTARYFLEHDPYDNNRMLGASALGALRRNSNDEMTLSVLAHCVINAGENAHVRAAAYRAMRAIINYNRDQQHAFAVYGLDFEKDIDWPLVNNYASLYVG